ncbi:hypothetical protein GCM10022277_28950 [Litoribacillus peritrichatus]|uniref:Lipoprotein n=1 Tax=Litoribacillus peritrichatus TaxID=718191 RepID=A0ABP7MWW9_9GAMM
MFYMKRLFVIVIVLALSGCVAYQVTPEGDFKQPEIKQEDISVTRENALPAGRHCFEPMLYVLTLGIIPAHCEDTYNLTADSKEIGKAKVTFIQGWAALLLVTLPSWEYGNGQDVGSEIKALVVGSD